MSSTAALEVQDALVAGGPAVVAVGGGHGQAITLRAARRYAGSLTAVVSVADDGGSSGRLRRQLGIIPPGDLRMCLVALARRPSLVVRAFGHRFDHEELAGHALGNLVVAGLLAVGGDVQEAIDEAGRLLDVLGRVIPATYEAVVLKAEADCGEVQGQTAVTRTPQIHRVSLVPSDPEPAAGAVAAIAAADQVVLGPGSLYTSVLAALSVPGVADAIRRSPATKVYVANLRAQAAETEGYDVSDHVDALQAHGVDVDVVLCDTDALPVGSPRARVVLAELANDSRSAHDPARLADALRVLVG